MKGMVPYPTYPDYLRASLSRYKSYQITQRTELNKQLYSVIQYNSQTVLEIWLDVLIGQLIITR